MDDITYSETQGWNGGDTRTLYAITDKRTGGIVVRPGGAMLGIGPAVDIEVATRFIAEQLGQKPLHSGWRVLEE